MNEFLPNPSGKDEEEEWIEIYNDSDSIIDIGNWQLDDAESGSAPFVFPKNTLIAPKSYIVFTRQITRIALNNDKDSVRLLLPEGAVFQEINYDKPPLGNSSARTSEGFIWNVPTPGTANLSIAVNDGNKEIIYQGVVKKDSTKESAQNIAIKYNMPDQKIKGGFSEVVANNGQETINGSPLALGTSKQTASVRDAISQAISNNLILVLAAVIIFGLTIGLLLARIHKKKINSLNF